MIILDGVMVPLDKHQFLVEITKETSKMGMTWSQLKRLVCAPTTSHFPLSLNDLSFLNFPKPFLKIRCVCSVAQSFQHFCDPTDYSLPGSSLHGIILARILEQVAISSSRGSSQASDKTDGFCTGRWILYR